MSFAEPLWLLLLAAVPLLWFIPRRPIHLGHSGVGLSDERAGELRYLQRLPLTLVSAALVCFSFSLAGPRVYKSEEPRQILARDIMVAVDISGSMGSQLPGYQSAVVRNGRNQSRRIDAAQDAVLSFAQNRFDLKSGDRVGLILFDDDPRVSWPLTNDLKQIFRKTDFLPLNVYSGEKALGAGTNFGAKGPGPIDAACQHFGEYGESPARVLIMVTDGEDELGEAAMKRLAALMKKGGVKLYVVGVGPTLASQEVDIKRLARDYMDGGENCVFLVEKSNDMQKCFNTIDQLERGPVTVTSFNNFQELYQYPLVAGFLLIGIWTLSLVLLLGVV